MAAAKSNTTSVYFTNSTTSKHGVKKEVLSFTNADACLIVHSLTTLFIDILTDFILVVTYFMNGHTFWGSCTLALVVIPAVIMQGFSLRWHMLDGTSGKRLFVAHVCLSGVFLRYVGVLRAGQEARRSGEVNDFQSYFHQQSDVCILHLFESFMESAPQIVLQFYIAVQIQHWTIWTGVSVAASLFSLTWAVSSYSRVMRRARPEKRHVSVCGLALQAIWRVGMISARITALVLFSICCQAWLFLLLGLHWLGMTVWVVLQKTDPNTISWEEYAYNGVVGVVYCFSFFNLREGRARARMLAFYLITVAQNLACLYLFLALKQHTYPFLAQFSAATIVCGTIIGLGAMLLYYRFFHSSGPISFFGVTGPAGAPGPTGAIGPPGAATVNDRQSRPCQNLSERSARPPPPSPSSLKTTAVQQKSQQNEMGPERTNSLRSLKRLWAVDRDGSLSSRSDDMPFHGGSPQSDDGCTDKRLLLSARCSGAPRRPIPSFGNLTTTPPEAALPPAPTAAVAVTAAASAVAPATASASQADPVDKAVLNIEDSQISWNYPSLMEDTQSSDTFALALDCQASVAPSSETEGSCLNKRRGICSSVEFGLDLLEDNTLGDVPAKDPGTRTSFAALCQKLVKQLVAAENDAEEIADQKRASGAKAKPRAPTVSPTAEEPEKRESDYIDSKQSEVQSSDGTPSEVLSAHDYENICAVNIAREAWGLRSWRGYSDMETWLHDDSVVRDRRRDTIVSVASSERSTASESPPPPAPPLPNRRPRPAYNRMDDYLDTLADDLAEIERREAVFLAQPYLVDPNGLMYPVPAPSSQLDTIMEELEESSVTSASSVPVGSPGWASSLVATIDEIRTGADLDTMTVSEGDFDVGSYHSLQFDTSVDQRLRFSCSLPSLLQTPRSWSHIPPEELVLKQKEQVAPTKVAQTETAACLDRLRLGDDTLRRSGNRPRRKFSLLRERFERPVLKAEAESEAVGADRADGREATTNARVEGNADVDVNSDSKSATSRHWNSYMQMQNRCNAQETSLKETAPTPNPFAKQQGQSVLKRVLTPPRLHTHKRSLVIASNASA